MEAPEKNVQRLVMEVDLVDLVVSDVRQHRDLI